MTVPNLEYLLKTKCFYEFVADHISYFTKNTLTHAFEGHGFDVLECFTINEDNDIAVVVQKKKALNIAGQFSEVKALIDELREIVASYKTQNKKVAVWGAGHRTLALISLGRLTDLAYIVDSAKFKQGKFSPVLHLNIVSPRHLKDEIVDLVIVMVPGLYPGEVLKTLENMDLDADVAVLRNNKIEFIKKKIHRSGAMKAKLIARAFNSEKTPLEYAVPLDTPYSVHIDVCSMCNFKCNFCFHYDKEAMRQKGYKYGSMSFNLFKKITDDLKKFKNKTRKVKIGLHGEPTLHPELPQMISYLKSQNVTEIIELFTNASLLNPKVE